MLNLTTPESVLISQLLLFILGTLLVWEIFKIRKSLEKLVNSQKRKKG